MQTTSSKNHCSRIRKNRLKSAEMDSATYTCSVPRSSRKPTFNIAVLSAAKLRGYPSWLFSLFSSFFLLFLPPSCLAWLWFRLLLTPVGIINNPTKNGRGVLVIEPPQSFRCRYERVSYQPTPEWFFDCLAKETTNHCAIAPTCSPLPVSSRLYLLTL
jgi:hypothetical protein